MRLPYLVFGCLGMMLAVHGVLFAFGSGGDFFECLDGVAFPVEWVLFSACRKAHFTPSLFGMLSAHNSLSPWVAFGYENHYITCRGRLKKSIYFA